MGGEIVPHRGPSVTLPTRANEALARLCPDRAGRGRVAAVSGGADSVALLRALAGLRPTVAHLNHRLRGTDSDADEAFVRDLAADLGLPFVSHRVDLPAGGNLENAARRARYEWLARVAADTAAGWIATGHTADDQAETVLHRLLRGTGLRGLRAIAERRDSSVPGVVIVRPLLGVTRADVLAYLADLGQPFRTDATNADVRFTRNRIRSELLPLLRTFNPNVVEALGRVAAQADELFAVTEAGAADLLTKAELPRAGGAVVLDAGVLTVAGEPRVRAALRAVWAREGWPTAGMSFAHWRRAARIAAGEIADADFPNGVRVSRGGRAVVLGPVSSPPRLRGGRGGWLALDPPRPPLKRGGEED